MTRPLPLFVRLLLSCVVGCEPVPATPPATPSTAAPSMTSAPTASHATPVAPTAVHNTTTYIAPKQKALLQGLEIGVDEIVVKRTMDGNEVLRAVAVLQADGKRQEHTFESDQRDPFVWNGYEIHMRGGSNEGAGFQVVRLK